MVSATRCCRATLTCFAVVLFVGAASASGGGRKKHSPNLHGQMAPVGIVDEVCAVALEIEVEAADADGKPVEDADVWMVDLAPPYPRANVAKRLGITGRDGRLRVPECLMGSQDFSSWEPAKHATVRFKFLVIRDGFGVGQLGLEPRVDEVLAEGNLTGVPPGTESKDWKYLKEWRGHHYSVHLRVELKRTVP